MKHHRSPFHSGALLALLTTVLCAAPSAQAQTGERGGKRVVDTVCAKCHAKGEAGAPRIGDKQAWRERAQQGLGGLTEHAVNGIRKMPAHGGQKDLSDLELGRAITYMVNQSGGKWIEPLSEKELGAVRTGKQVVDLQCSKCHATGERGAPKIGDRDAWIPILKKGVDNAVNIAIHGHGGMKPRGERADLKDEEIRNAILYMFSPATGK